MTPILHERTERLLQLFLNQPSHALALVGDTGAGKDYVAEYIVAQLLNLPPDHVAQNPSVFAIAKSADEGDIEQVRNLQNFLSLKVPGTAAIRRCVIIHLIEQLSREAQNAILKTLEEPPLDTVIICTVSDRQRLPSTIASRVQWLEILPLSLQRATTEFKDYTSGAVERAFYISEGNVGLLMALLHDQIDHPLVAVINEARTLLTASSYERLIAVELIVKDKQRNLAELLDGLYRLLHAAVQSAAKADNKNLKRLNSQISCVLKAQELLAVKTHPKVLLSWLFYSL